MPFFSNIYFTVPPPPKGIFINAGTIQGKDKQSLGCSLADCIILHLSSDVAVSQ